MLESFQQSPGLLRNDKIYDGALYDLYYQETVVADAQIENVSTKGLVQNFISTCMVSVDYLKLIQSLFAIEHESNVLTSAVHELIND